MTWLRFMLALQCQLAAGALSRFAASLMRPHVAERKPPRRAAAADKDATPPAETPIAPEGWRLPSPGEVDRARGGIAAYALPHLKICRGPHKGCDVQIDQPDCANCFVVHWHDRRSSAEILDAMVRGDA